MKKAALSLYKATGYIPRYCQGCDTWKTPQDYRGAFSRSGNLCAACRKVAQRKPIGARLRFLILRRDGFKCQYCGRSAPHVELHVDHVNPVSKGGTYAPENLVSACVECNLGKHNLAA